MRLTLPKPQHIALLVIPLLGSTTCWGSTIYFTVTDETNFLGDAETGNLQGVKDTLNEFPKDKYPNVINTKQHDDKGGNTALHLACKGGHQSVVEYLVSKGADLNAQNKYKWTPCIVALKQGKTDVAQYLLTQKNINVNIPDQMGWTVLHYACDDADKQAFVEIAKQILRKNPKMNAYKFKAESPLHLLIKHNKVALAKDLLAAGHNPNHQGYHEKPPLFLACKAGNLDMVKLLLDQDGINVYLKDFSGKPIDEFIDKKSHPEIYNHIQAYKKKHPAQNPDRTKQDKNNLQNKLTTPSQNNNQTIIIVGLVVVIGGSIIYYFASNTHQASKTRRTKRAQ